MSVRILVIVFCLVTASGSVPASGVMSETMSSEPSPAAFHEDQNEEGMYGSDGRGKGRNSRRSRRSRPSQYANVEPLALESDYRRGSRPSAYQKKDAQIPYPQKGEKCDPMVFKHSCTRDLRGIGKACNGKFIGCECIYKDQQVSCAKGQTCSKLVCGNVCIKCEGDPKSSKAEKCPDEYGQGVVTCKWPMSLLTSGACGKWDANCPAGSDLNTKYCKKGYKIQMMNAAGCGRCIEE